MSEKRPTLEYIITTTFDLARVVRHIMSNMAKEGVQVNALQLFALAALQTKEEMTMKELADCLYVTGPSATSFVNRLVKLRLVTRMRVTGNRRVVRLRLTPKGRAVLNRKREKRAAMIKRILGLLTNEEQRQLAVIIDKLHRACPHFASR
jgi:DNA-binding MarR family transcriptional regulator